MLKVIDHHKRYGDTEALAGVSFSVEAGELFGLLGPNGAGKTICCVLVQPNLEYPHR